jgi:hypothetical protein
LTGTSSKTFFGWHYKTSLKTGFNIFYKFFWPLVDVYYETEPHKKVDEVLFFHHQDSHLLLEEVKSVKQHTIFIIYRNINLYNNICSHLTIVWQYLQEAFGYAPRFTQKFLLTLSGSVHVLWSHSNILFTFKLINLCSYWYWTL